MQSTYVPKKGDIQRRWHLVDATDLVLGRLCTGVVFRLTGKNKPQYTPYIDVGDHVIVINAAKIKLTGNKAKNKIYYRHTGYPGGLKTETAGDLMARRPDRLIKSGVRGMLPKTKMGRAMLKKLKVYAGPDHPHEAQGPVPLDVTASWAEKQT